MLTGASLWLDRARRSASIAAHLAREPRRSGDLLRWVRERRASTLDARQPWWPYRATEAVAAELRPGAAVFEFGGGGSTLWFHDRGANITCVEDDRSWYETLRTALPADVTVLLRQPSASGVITSQKKPGQYYDAYVAALAEQPDSSLDLVVVDGRARVDCGLAARAKLKPGGLLLLDDSDRAHYQPLIIALDGWQRTVVTGLKLGEGMKLCQTSIWRRPLT